MTRITFVVEKFVCPDLPMAYPNGDTIYKLKVVQAFQYVEYICTPDVYQKFQRERPDLQGGGPFELVWIDGVVESYTCLGGLPLTAFNAGLVQTVSSIPPTQQSDVLPAYGAPGWSLWPQSTIANDTAENPAEKPAKKPPNKADDILPVKMPRKINLEE